MRQLQEGCGEEFRAFHSCLDRHHNQYSSCRKKERALLDCWNAMQEKKVRCSRAALHFGFFVRRLTSGLCAVAIMFCSKARLAGCREESGCLISSQMKRGRVAG